MDVTVIAGVFLIVGSAIAAAAAYFTTRLQLASSKDLDIDRRLFDARRAAYERAMGMISKAHSERVNGRRWPTSSLDPDNDKTLDAMGVVALWSSKETVVKMREFFGYLNSAFPTDKKEKDADMLKGNTLWQDLILAFRKEVGTGDFLEETIPTLPTEEEIKR